MPEWQAFENLAAKARSEVAPSLDVVGQVLHSLRARSRRASRVDTPLLLFAGAALVAAVLLATFALPAWDSVHNPLVFQFKPLTLVMR
ncbi:MAG TPA: hypothetical protein VMV69_23445 [Pirellulales bacterium]|nr:hypothetical protein [Pirellulales bacterium]